MFRINDLMFFEKIFIDGGYVLDFTDDSFKDFVKNSIGIDISEEDFINKVKSEYPSSSKKNKLKYLWNNEDDDKVFQLVSDLIDYYSSIYENPDYDSLEKAKEILENIPNKNLKIATDFSEKRIKELEIEINKNITEGRYIFAIDRLHTFMHNYLRTISESHQIEFKDKDRLDELYKGYVNFLKYNGYIESKLSKTIFRSNLSIFNEFNEVRNHKTYAHDNEVLNNLESQLVVNNIINIAIFISRIEEKIK